MFDYHGDVCIVGGLGGGGGVGKPRTANCFCGIVQMALGLCLLSSLFPWNKTCIQKCFLGCYKGSVFSMTESIVTRQKMY